MRLTRAGEETASKLAAARRAAAEKEVEGLTFTPTLVSTAAAAAAGAVYSAALGEGGRARSASMASGGQGSSTGGGSGGAAGSRAAATTSRLYAEAMESSRRKEELRVALLEARDRNSLVGMRPVPAVNESSRMLAELVRARKVVASLGGLAATMGVLVCGGQWGVLEALREGAGGAGGSGAGGSGTGSPFATTAASASEDVWSRLCQEAAAFAQARVRAMGQARALARVGPGAPTFAPSLGVTSETLALARQAAELLAVEKEGGQGEGGSSGSSGSSGSGSSGEGLGVWPKLLAASISEAGLRDMAEELARGLAGGGQGEGGEEEAAALAEEEAQRPSLGEAASLRLAELVRESSQVGKAVEAARLLFARDGGARGSSSQQFWEELASQKRDVELYASLKAELELRQCTFAPNQGAALARAPPAAIWDRVKAEVAAAEQLP